MIRPGLAAAALAALVATSAARAATLTYDFSTAPGATAATGTSLGGQAVTPFTLNGATFSSPSDPRSYTVGLTGLSTPLSTVPVLSSAGSVSALDIAFSAPQTAISFAFDLDTLFAAGDTITLTPNVGAPTTVASTLVSGDFVPSGTLSYSGAGFTSVAITSADPLEIGNLTTTGTAVPEPASFALLAVGLLSLASLRRRA